MRKPKPNEETEWHIKKEVKKVLEAAGWKYWMPSANAFGRSGVVDFLCTKRPRLFMAIETKYEDVVTQLQYEFLQNVYEAEHYAFLVDETNIDKLDLILYDISINKYNDIAALPFLKWKRQDLFSKIRAARD